MGSQVFRCARVNVLCSSRVWLPAAFCCHGREGIGENVTELRLLTRHDRWMASLGPKAVRL